MIVTRRALGSGDAGGGALESSSTSTNVANTRAGPRVAAAGAPPDRRGRGLNRRKYCPRATGSACSVNGMVLVTPGRDTVASCAY
jgi:hypothetical protein